MLRNSSRLRNLRYVTRCMVSLTSSTPSKVQPTTISSIMNKTRLYATQQKKVIPYTVERLSGFVRDDKYKKVNIY